MKKTSMQGKLCLNKKVIVTLNTKESQKVQGGTNGDTTSGGIKTINYTVDRTIIDTAPTGITGQ